MRSSTPVTISAQNREYLFVQSIDVLGVGTFDSAAQRELAAGIIEAAEFGRRVGKIGRFQIVTQG
jgi:hypothetical protein